MKKHLLKTLFAGAFLSMFTPLTASADVEINEMNFPDENFRNWLLEQDYGQDGIITDGEIASITYIGVYRKNISSLKGIEYFTALTRLSCYNNQLSSLDVSNNTALTDLDCHSNELISLNVSHNTALTYLDCYYNYLTSLDVSNNTALTYLSCPTNQLTSLDVSKNTALTYLYCTGNQLTSLDVSKNTALTDLSCTGNRLTSLDVSQNTALTYLSCGINQLTSLDVSKNTALTQLQCFANQLSSLDVSHNTALTGLECYQNLIKGVSMDALIESLPVNNTIDCWLYIYAPDDSEGNVCTRSQVAAIKEKGWTPFYSDDRGGTWQEYEGSDDDPSSIAKPIIETENANTPVYNLSGQKVENVKKGIYIVNGHKVVIK